MAPKETSSEVKEDLNNEFNNNESSAMDLDRSTLPRMTVYNTLLIYVGYLCTVSVGYYWENTNFEW